METETQLNSEVQQALNKYSIAIEGALSAAQKLEAISITAHLAEMFGCNEQKAAQTIQQDYALTT